MSEPSSLPGLELAAALTDEGRRVLMGHWVAAAVEPLQRGLELLKQPGVREAPEAGGLVIEALSSLNLALDAGGRFEGAAAARAELQGRLGEVADPLARAIGLWSLSCAAQLRGDVAGMLSLAGRAIQVQAPQALPMAAVHHALLGWALVMDGETDEGLDALHASAVLRRRHGSEIALPWLMATTAEARLAAGELEGARRDLEAAHAALAPEGPGFMHGAAWRVRGSLRWAVGEGLAAARVDWEQALAIDHAAGAPLCELRTLLVLGRALAASGEKALARERLAEVLGRLGAASSADTACPVLDIARRQLAAWA
jgi:ATP/maltotriose-dependent transcriptional regulator MalT